jgi:2',3'-cyclic-nucleotide 2'-phosphodiesterase/3'-nucleotidase
MKKLFPLLACAVVLLLPGLLFAPAARAQQLQLRLLETTDVHMSLLPFDYYQNQPVAEYGLARTATLIARARAQVPNSLLFDDGDMIQGNPLGDFVARLHPLADGQVHPAIELMNALHYDAAAIGNHEFNYGLDFLHRVLAGASFPWLNANLVMDPAAVPARAASAPVQAFTPYVILDRQFTDDQGAVQHLKVGVIGFAPPQVMQWDRENLQGRLKALDIAATARTLVPRMRAEGADLVVVLAHSGLARGDVPPMSENEVGLLARVPGVSAILFGHSHGEFPGPFFADFPDVDVAQGRIHGVPATMPGFWGSHLGVIDLVLKKDAGSWQVLDSHAEIRPVYDRQRRQALAEPDPALVALVQQAHQATVAAMGAEVARSTAPITSYFARVAADPSVQLVADAQRAYARQLLAGTPWAGLPLLSAAAPFKTGARGGVGGYTDVPAGPITLRNVADLYVYPNTVKILRLSGAQVREWLEFSAGAFRRIDPQGAPVQDLLEPAFPSYNFDTLDGVSYRIDLTQPARYARTGALAEPAAHRIVELRWQGKPVDDRAFFAVVTNNYRASGGGNFPGLDGSNIIVNAPEENREVLVDYLRTQRVVQPHALAAWQFVPVPGIGLRFVSGAGGVAQLASYPGIKLVQAQADGSAVYQLQP